jgi:hypothetical protein
MTFFRGALSRMTVEVCKPPLADLGGREECYVVICHHSRMQRPCPMISLIIRILGWPGRRV